MHNYLLEKWREERATKKAKKSKSKGKHKDETPEERRARKERKKEKRARREARKSEGLKGVEALLKSLGQYEGGREELSGRRDRSRSRSPHRDWDDGRARKDDQDNQRRR